MHTMERLVLLASLAALPLTATAQATGPKLQAGLWEHGMSMKTGAGPMDNRMKQMQQSMASLPPDQRKMVEEMMARQGVGIGATGQTLKLCLSKEDVERDTPPRQEGCTQTSRRHGNVWQVSFQCKGPPPSSGEGEITVASPTAYAGNFTVRTVDQGQTQTVQMSQTGKWLSADCGSIRPISAKP